MNEATWECEWCGKSEPISSMANLFRWFLPRYCRVTGDISGWPHPSCRFSARLADRIAYREAKKVKRGTLKNIHGATLGELRGHELSIPSDSPEMIMRKDLD